MNSTNTRMEELFLRARGPTAKVMEALVSTFENVGATHAGFSNVMKRKNERSIPERIKAIFTGQTFRDYAEGRDAYTQAIWDSMGMPTPNRKRPGATATTAELSILSYNINRAPATAMQMGGSFIPGMPMITSEIKVITKELKAINENTKPPMPGTIKERPF